MCVSRPHGRLVRIVGYLLGVHDKAISTMPVDGSDRLTEILTTNSGLVEEIRLYCSTRNYLIRKYAEISYKLRRYRNGGIPPRFAEVIDDLGYRELTLGNYLSIIKSLTINIVCLVQTNYEKLFPIDSYDYTGAFSIGMLTEEDLRELANSDMSQLPFGTYIYIAKMAGENSKFTLSNDEDLRAALSNAGYKRDIAASCVSGVDRDIEPFDRQLSLESTEVGRSEQKIEELLMHPYIIYVDCDNANLLEFLAFRDRLHNTGLWKNCKRCVLFRDDTTLDIWSYILGHDAEVVRVPRVIREKSCVDMAIAVRIAKDATWGVAHVGVLFSSDSDYMPIFTGNLRMEFVAVLQSDRASSKYISALCTKSITWSYGSRYLKYLDRDAALRYLARDCYIKRMEKSPFDFTTLDCDTCARYLSNDISAYGLTNIDLKEISEVVSDLQKSL